MRREITKHDLEQVQCELRWVCQHNQDRRPLGVVLDGRHWPETHSVNSLNLVSKDMCASVFWQIKPRPIIYFASHLRSCLAIRPHGSEVKVTSRTCERVVGWTLPRQTPPPASSSKVSVRKNNHSASGLLAVAVRRSQSVYLQLGMSDLWGWINIFLIYWARNKRSGCIYFSFLLQLSAKLASLCFTGSRDNMTAEVEAEWSVMLWYCELLLWTITWVTTDGWF